MALAPATRSQNAKIGVERKRVETHIPSESGEKNSDYSTESITVCSVTFKRKNRSQHEAKGVTTNRDCLITVLIDSRRARGVTGADECPQVPTARPPVSYKASQAALRASM
jgi:hypothetical protein